MEAVAANGIGWRQHSALTSEQTRDLDIGLEKPDQDAIVTAPKVPKEEEPLATVGS